MEKPTAAHNPEVVGSSPAPATTKAPLSGRKAVLFSALLQLLGTSPFPGHRVDPNRDHGSPEGGRQDHGEGSDDGAVREQKFLEKERRPGDGNAASGPVF